MAVQRTLSIIKPDATSRNITGTINSFFEGGGLHIIAQRRLRLSKSQVQAFYEIHKGRPFYDGLCDYMCSAPIVVQVLEGEDAIQKTRSIMGTTDPASADEGTIRKTFGLNVQQNSVHGSDSPEHADTEIRFFFSDCEIVG